MKKQTIGFYFKREKILLLLISISGIIYNIGMTAGPYFEGQLVQRLFEVRRGTKTMADMVSLALLYLFVILCVQGMRFIKRFYVRRFANNTNRSMRHNIYHNLLYKSREELQKEGTGPMMTKAIQDVDACVEGMRKVTTEVFDTGVVLIAYLGMLFYLDIRLAFLACLFTPFAYVAAEKMKKVIYRYHTEYKKSAESLNTATMDRISSAVTYRVFGREEAVGVLYEGKLADYERKAVWANMWENTLQPIYQIISMTGVVFIIYFGARNVNGNGWVNWDIAAFTTFLSCFTKMAVKSSKAAKLFNAVQKARVSWKRIEPFLNDDTDFYIDKNTRIDGWQDLKVEHLSFRYSEENQMIQDLSFTAKPGEIIGVTGPVASGKTTLGRILLGELPYKGSIKIGGCELAELNDYEKSRHISYMGHDPELMSDSIQNNIALGDTKEIKPYIEMVCLDKDMESLEQGQNTYVGNGGVCLSGGQQARCALARTLCHGRSVLILDDPFSAVDQKTESEIMDNMKEFIKDKIVIILTHRLSMFSKFDRIIWVDNGECETASHEDMMSTNKAYAKLYRAQTERGDSDEA